jgi:uncharacterized protein
MQPNLTWLTASGDIRAQSAVPGLAQASIRHLALAARGQVAFAMQWEGDPAEAAPLLGLWVPGGAAKLCPAPEAEAHRMRGYAGSVACTATGQIAITSPKGGVAQIFDAFGRFVATQARHDICGLAPLGQHSFLASDGTGALLTLSADGLRRLGQSDVQWDNHIVSLQGA